MNSVTRSLPVPSIALNCESRKRPNKKRHRNKSRNCNLKKKRLKKFHGRKKTATTKLNTSKLDFMSVNNPIMSNWYWSNYEKALEWQEKHKVAYWKSCALALYEENRHLLQIINQLHPGLHPKLPLNHNHLLKEFSSREKQINLNRFNNKRNSFGYINSDDNGNDNDNNIGNVNDDSEEEEEEETNDIEFELSEEMMEFFEQSYKHKMEMKELKKKESLQNAEDEIKQIQTNKVKRATEMNQLYGDGASMIIGMETAVQLSFEKYCDTKSPKYWPNIPFRL